MAKTSILEGFKMVIADMLDSNGNFRVTPIGTTGRLNLSNNRIKLLIDVIKLLRDTDIISDETRIYIFNKYITIKGVNEIINDRMGGKEEVKFNNTLSKIQYDKNKLERLLGKDFFGSVLSSNRDISLYEKIVYELYIKYSKTDKIRENLILNIPKDCMSTELSDEEFNEFIQIISPYLKSQIKFIEENLSRKACGYFNYLLSVPTLEGKDKERAEILRALLSYSEDSNSQLPHPI